MTTRHLADTIGYTQPVLYGHFPGGKSEIILAVAFEGFVDLTQRCRAALGRKQGRRAIEAVAVAYLDFGVQHPAVYEAMFQQPIDARFAADDSEPELRAGCDVLAEAIGDDGDGTATEVFWVPCSASACWNVPAACARSTAPTAWPSSASASRRIRPASQVAPPSRAEPSHPAL